MSVTKKETFALFTQLQGMMHYYHKRNMIQHGPMDSPTRGQGRVLAILKLKPEMSQKELSHLLDIRKQSLAELLSKLERNGYIKRESLDTDRRISIVKLTEEGKKAAEEMRDDEESSNIYKLFNCLNDEELESFYKYLERMINYFEEEFADEEYDFHKEKFKHFMDESRCWRHGHSHDRFGHHHKKCGHHYEKW